MSRTCNPAQVPSLGVRSILRSKVWPLPVSRVDGLSSPGQFGKEFDAVAFDLEAMMGILPGDWKVADEVLGRSSYIFFVFASLWDSGGVHDLFMLHMFGVLLVEFKWLFDSFRGSLSRAFADLFLCCRLGTCSLVCL